MGIQMRKKLWYGQCHEQKVYNVPDGVRRIEAYDPEKAKKDRFENPEAYKKFKLEISRRNHNRLFHANFSPSSLYSTLTFDDDWEVHTFEEARKIRKSYIGMLKRKYPDAVIFLYMGRGKGTNRIHFHMVSEGVPEEFIVEKWKYGRIRHIANLREHCWYEGVDRGQDYTGLANYLFNHWTEEIGGHRWFMTKNARKPDVEEPTEVKVAGGYSAKRPPKAPKGYTLVEINATCYGYWSFKYIVMPQKAKKNRNKDGT
jgi:hypothetical protein